MNCCAITFYRVSWIWLICISKGINILRRSSVLGISMLVMGVPRVLQKTIYLNAPTNDWVQAEMQYSTRVKCEIGAMLADCRPLSTLEDVSTGAASHKVFFFALLDEESLFSRHYELKIGTKYLQDLLLQEVSATCKAQQRSFYHRLLEVPSLKDAAGRIFEQATHQFFKKGGRFRLGRTLDASDKLPAIAPFDLNQAEEFRNLKDWGATLHKPNSSRLLPERKGVYFMPLKSNLTSIDSIILAEISKMLVVILLQITVGSTHPVKASGIDEIYAVLPQEVRKAEVRLVFVVPQESKLTTKQAITPSGGKPPWEGRLKQRVLQLSEDTLFKD